MQKSLLSKEDVATLQSYCEGNSGYFYAILEYLEDFIENGVAEKLFTRKRAKHDLEIALWVSYACGNIDTYEYYYKSMTWLQSVEDLAAGCGMFYYRYAVALTYCGKLEKAKQYAEKGVLEEPNYPWGWLHLANLRSHFGDKMGALEANAKGLALLPNDYEFTRQREEIQKGYTLEQLENHYIAQESDKALQSGEVSEQESRSKLEAIAGIVCDEKNLQAIKDLLQVEDWQQDVPYCLFTFSYQNQKYKGVFRMNAAAVSKIDLKWLKQNIETLSETIEKEKKRMGRREGVDGKELIVSEVIFERDYSIHLQFVYPKQAVVPWICA